ncbi:MAG TPA: MIP family channel protein [Acidimicrobiales bacterium]|nr:MIP family channel protein [Acidimicrobiales bacterium]
MSVRKLAAEALGTALLVIFAVGAATLSFGFKLTGTSTSAGVVTTALAFGLVLAALAYTLGPVSGCHVNPAVTVGFLVARRISWRDAVGYWIAQFVGGIAGALVLWGVLESSPQYTKSVGLGADGYNAQSMLHVGVLGAFAAEVILTFLFVFVVLQVTKHTDVAAVAGLAIGLTLTIVHIVGIPLTGTSVNPARSLGPALIVHGEALKQLWLFIVAPMVGGALAALASTFFVADASSEVEFDGEMEIDVLVKMDGHTMRHATVR